MYSKLTIIGNLGTDPQMRYLADGTAVTNFSVATNRRWTNQAGEQQSETTWFRVSVWGKQGEACNLHLAKGRQVMVEGRLRPDANGGPRLFERNNGSVGASYEVVAQTVQFLGSRSEGSQTDEVATGDETDEIPF